MSSAFLPKTEDADEDPVTLMLKKTGCIDLHYKVQVIAGDTRLIRGNTYFCIFLGVHRRDPGLAEVSRHSEDVQRLHAGVH